MYTYESKKRIDKTFQLHWLVYELMFTLMASRWTLQSKHQREESADVWFDVGQYKR
jgi:hypothetical protein